MATEDPDGGGPAPDPGPIPVVASRGGSDAAAAPDVRDEWSSRDAVAVLAAVAGVALAFVAAWRLAFIFIVAVLAIVLHLAVRVPVEALAARRIERRLAVALVYGIVGVLLVGGTVRLAPVLARQAAAAIESLPTQYAVVRDAMSASDIEAVRVVARSLPGAMSPDRLLDLLAPPADAEEPRTGVLTVAFLTRSLFLLSAVIALAALLTLDRDRLLYAPLLALAPGRRDAVRALLGELEGTIGSYFRGQLVLSAVVGLLSWAAYTAIGLPHALALAAAAFLLESVPMIGPLLLAIPAVLVGLSVSPGMAMAVVAVQTAIQVIEGNLLVPRVMDRAVGVSPLVTLVAVAAMAELFGLLGALLAVPLAAVAQIVAARLLFGGPSPSGAPPLVDDATEMSRSGLGVARYQAQRLAAAVLRRQRDPDLDLSDAVWRIEERIEATALDADRLLASGEVDLGIAPAAAPLATAAPIPAAPSRPRRAALLAVAAFGVLAVALVLWRLRALLAFLLIGVVLVAAGRGVLVALMRRGVGDRAARLAVLVLGLVVLVAVSAVTVRALVQAPAAVAEVADAYGAWRSGMADEGAAGRLLVARLPTQDRVAAVLVGGGTTGALQHMTGMAVGVVQLVANVLLVVVLAAYWGVDRRRYLRVWLSLLPPRARQRVRRAWHAVEGDVGAYARSEAVQTVLAFALLVLAYRSVGLPYAVLAAWLAAVLSLVPLIGWILALAPAVVLGLVFVPTGAALAVLLTVAVLALLEWAVERRLDPRRRAGSVLGLLVALALIDLVGVVGLLAAPALTIAMQAGWVAWRESMLTEDCAAATSDGPLATIDVLGSGEDLAALGRRQLATIDAELDALGDDAATETRSLRDRLAEVIDAAVGAQQAI